MRENYEKVDLISNTACMMQDRLDTLTKKVFFSARGSSGITGFRNVVVLLTSGCKALDNGHVLAETLAFFTLAYYYQ